MPADLAKLRAVTSAEPTVRALFEALRRTNIRTNLTTVKNIARHYDPPAGGPVRHSDLVHALRLVESCGFGSLLQPGSRLRARFLWNVQPEAAREAALNPHLEIQPQEYLHSDANPGFAPAPPQASPVAAGWRRHTFPLRREVDLTLDLPTDLSEPEARRLGHFLLSLAGLKLEET